jgi:hypothetical protein
MELTQDDIWFFSDEGNWMSGPTYDLELVVADSIKSAQDAISSFPGLTAWQPRGEQTRSIGALGEGFRPFGVLHLMNRLVIYPPQMRYVCGQEIWQDFRTDSSIAAPCGLHQKLLEWVRWVHGQVPVVSAVAFDETRSMPGDLDILQHHFWLHNSVARVIGWTGTRLEDWVGVQI